jgi:hypothetical protein
VGRARKKGASGNGEFSLFDESEPVEGDSDEDLPRDEAGRAKIKHQYVELLGIRVQKLAGRILNRERINKTLEGIYFVCIRCQKVCHNLDEGLVEDTENKNNSCSNCARQAAEAARAALKKPVPSKAEPAAAPAAAKKKPASRSKPVASARSSVVRKKK